MYIIRSRNTQIRAGVAYGQPTLREQHALPWGIAEKSVCTFAQNIQRRRE
jgi:hypothetical protein